MFDKISSIAAFKCFVDIRRIRNITYIINDSLFVEVHLPEYHRPVISNKIKEEMQEFVNGYKVVRTSNGEYAYVRESDNTLLPYRYDIASNFNEYGLAMVGKDGNVSWINKNFEYINRDGELVKEDLSLKYNLFYAFTSVSDFSKGAIPLSCLKCNKVNETIYLETDGNIKLFSDYAHKRDINNTFCFFLNGNKFNSLGYALADDYLLFASGYYIEKNELINLCMEKGYLDKLANDIIDVHSNDREIDRKLVLKK